MRYSSQALFGFMAILSIASVQTMDMSHGNRHFYARAVNDISTDDGMIFDTRIASTVDVNAQLSARHALGAG